MSRNNYLQLAHSLLVVAPEVLEKYINRHYHGGLTCAIRNLKETLRTKLLSEQWDKVEELIDLSKPDLHQYYDQLINKTVLDKSVLDFLISKCVMTREDREEVSKQSRQSDRNKMILDILIGRPYDAYNIFMVALRQSDENDEDIIDQLHQTEIAEQSHVTISATACRGQIGSTLDVDTMITLVSVILGLEIPPPLPPKEDTSIGADLCRLKSYVRYIINRDDIDDEMMAELFPLITAPFFNDIMSSSFYLGRKPRPSVGKLAILINEDCPVISLKLIIRLNGPGIEENLKTNLGQEMKKKLNNILKSIKDKEEKVIPSNIRDQIKRRISEWEKNNKKFVTTVASKHVLQSVRTNSCVTVTGSPGSGKTAIVHHVALTLQQEGYRVIPVDIPTDIRTYYQTGIPTVFIIDDMCGNFTVNQQLIESWKQMLDTVKLITEDKSCKIIISCRLQIYKDPSFDILKPFKMVECNIISETICLNLTERKAIAESYLGTHATEIDEVLQMHDYLPLLCYLYDETKHHDVKEFFNNPFAVFQAELDNLYNHGDEGKYKICALALCVMFNNKLKEEYFTGKDPHVKNVIEETLEALELNRGTSRIKLKKSLETLDGTFICRQEGLYRTRHDKVFDFLTCYFGRKMLECIIQNSDRGVVRERFKWMTSDKDETDFMVELPDYFLELYLDKLISDWSHGNVCCVFENNNLKYPSFRARFLGHVSKLDRSEKTELVNKKDNVTTVDNALGQTALISACYNGYMDLIQWLLDNGADAGATRKDGISPLYFACQKGLLEVVCKILECNEIDPNLRHKDGGSPLFIACQKGHLEVVGKLLECQNVDPNICDRWLHMSPLYIACQKGHLEVVTKLLKCNNVDLNHCQRIGWSPLYIACQEHHLEVVCKLLECDDVDPNIRDRKFGRSPLYIACQKGHLEVVCKLLECNKVDPNLCDKDGMSPLYTACQSGHLEVVRKLLEIKNVDPNLCDKDDMSPLYTACQNGHLEVVRKLLEIKNVDPNLCDKVGWSPLYTACMNGHLEVVGKLLECKNIDPNLCDNCGWSPLYLACHVGRLEVICKFLECKKVNPNLCAKDDWSPLHIACQNGQLEVVIKLLKFKADSGLRTNSGKLPVDIATEKGYTDIVSVLKHASLYSV